MLNYWSIYEVLIAFYESLITGALLLILYDYNIFIIQMYVKELLHTTGNGRGELQTTSAADLRNSNFGCRRPVDG